MRPAGLHAQMNQTRLLLAGDGFHAASQGHRSAIQKLALVARVAHRGSGHRAHGQNVQAAVRLGHAGEDLRYKLHGVVTDAPILENAGAETSDLALFGENPGLTRSVDFGGQHSHRVAPDVHCGVARHAPMV